MTKINEKINKEIIDKQRLDDAVQTLCADIESQSESAIDFLKSRFNDLITEEEKSLETFSNIEKFEDFINDARTSYINNVTYLPKVECDRINAMYDNLHDSCVPYVKTLQRIKELPYHLTYNGKKFMANSEEIRNAISKNFVAVLSEEQIKYYGLLAKAKNALSEITSFEVKNNFEKFCGNGFYSDTKMNFYRRIEFFPYLLQLNEQNFLNSCRAGMFEKKF